MLAVIVSHTYKFIFFRTEKTGSSSLFEALSQVMGEGVTSNMARPAWAKYSPIHHGALKRKIPDWFGFHAHATAKQALSLIHI